MWARGSEALRIEEVRMTKSISVTYGDGSRETWTEAELIARVKRG